MITIYHNPACSKSRAALELLRQHGTEPAIVEYLAAPLDVPALWQLLERLRMRPMELVRHADALKAGFAIDGMTDAAIVQCLAEHPALIERPLVVNGDRAVVGRPPERVLELL